MYHRFRICPELTEIAQRIININSKAEVSIQACRSEYPGVPEEKQIQKPAVFVTDLSFCI
jgi:hypothetical protein